jgi:hypothetical protein
MQEETATFTATISSFSAWGNVKVDETGLGQA